VCEVRFVALIDQSLISYFHCWPLLCLVEKGTSRPILSHTVSEPAAGAPIVFGSDYYDYVPAAGISSADANAAAPLLHSTQNAALQQAKELLCEHGCDLEISLHLSPPLFIWFTKSACRIGVLRVFRASESRSDVGELTCTLNARANTIAKSW
jgi:hypothetical protein